MLSLMDLWNQNSYHDYNKLTSASWLWRRHHDVRYNQNNRSALTRQKYTGLFRNLIDLLRACQNGLLQARQLYSSVPYLSHAAVDEHFTCERELLNTSDTYVVAVLKDDVVVGHLPRQLSWILSLFLLKNGTVDCVVIGGRRYTSDLPQEGLEIPCKLIFNGKRDDIKKLKHLLARKAPAFSSNHPTGYGTWQRALKIRKTTFAGLQVLQQCHLRPTKVHAV